MQELVYWIWLSLAVTPGTDNFHKLISEFKDPRAIYEANDTEIIGCIGSRSRDSKALAEKDLSEAQRILDFCERKKVGILTYSDELFPKSLREIDKPPVLLYYRGILPNFNNNCFISMVGTRRLTDYGRKNAFVIAQDLAKSGAIIVSGMAIGIDGVSHAGSISAGGINVAFLGSGIDVCYPDQHRRLAQQIVKNGCVMTEFAPGTRPERGNFPRRNRLIAGISCATIVIEGKINSGSLITARYAKDFGKKLYALPGNVDNKTSEASNILIQNGAKLILSADDVVKDFEFVYPGKINPFKIAQRISVSMNEVFADLKIACVAQSDNIFSVFSSKRRKRNNDFEDNEISNNDTQSDENKNIKNTDFSIENLSFDKDVLRIYKKIPVDRECTIDSLVDATDSMPIVMKSLLKLEMGKAIIMLPGEKVKRNFK